MHGQLLMRHEGPSCGNARMFAVASPQPTRKLGLRYSQKFRNTPTAYLDGLGLMRSHSRSRSLNRQVNSTRCVPYGRSLHDARANNKLLPFSLSPTFDEYESSCLQSCAPESTLFRSAARCASGACVGQRTNFYVNKLHQQ